MESITRTFVSTKGEEFEAVRDVSFDVRDSESLVLLRLGLCGKAVLLNILTGPEEATSDMIRLDDQELKGCSDRISMVLQKLGLFSRKTVMEDVEVGLGYTGMSKKGRRERAQKFIDLVGLIGFEGAYPGQLSDGMKQRVEIARAYTADPEILIPDEPFGQPDTQTRYSMEDEIFHTRKQEKKTVTSVTNSIEEVVYLEDRIILLEKCPTPVKEIYGIDLPGPRSMMGETLLELRTRISDNIELSV